MLPEPTIREFDSYLTSEGLKFEAIVIGGAALVLLGVIERQTRDFDILDPVLPEEVAEASRRFAEKLVSDGTALDSEWLNNGPASLTATLPDGWRTRLQLIFEGDALTLRTLGRSDLLKTKLFALCDRGTDLPDCIAMAPTPQELEEAEPWLAIQDANPQWPEHVRNTLDDLQQRLDHGI